MKKKRLTKAQSSFPILNNPKRKIARALGVFLFLIGSALISDSFLNITGNVTAGNVSRFSLWGLVLDIIGFILIIIKIEDKS